MKRMILNEKEYATGLIRAACLGDNPCRALICVARYYFYLGLPFDAVRQQLITLFSDELRCGDYPLDRLLKEAKKRELLVVDSIPVTEYELWRIRGIHGLQRQRVAFALLVVAKYQNLLRLEDNDWVNFSHKKIFSLANVKMSVNQQGLLFSDLKSMGLLQFSQRANNTNVKVLYLEPDGEAVLAIQDMRNLGYQYMRHYGGAYLNCVACGTVVPRKSPRQKYCADCAALKNAKKTVAQYREKTGE